MNVRISAGDWGGNYETDDGRAAVRAFFQDVLAKKIKMCQLGLIASWREAGGGEEFVFRIAPALYRAGVISLANVTASFRAADLEFIPQDIEAMAEADKWMLPDELQL